MSHHEEHHDSNSSGWFFFSVSRMVIPGVIIMFLMFTYSAVGRCCKTECCKEKCQTECTDKKCEHGEGKCGHGGEGKCEHGKEGKCEHGHEDAGHDKGHEEHGGGHH